MNTKILFLYDMMKLGKIALKKKNKNEEEELVKKLLYGAAYYEEYLPCSRLE